MTRVSRPSRGFSLVELLLAIFILGIGVISVAAVFPAGIALQRQTNDDTLGPLVAQHAMSVLRSRLKQEDFGSFSQFNANAWPYTVKAAGAPIDIFTIQGDWPWMRPGFIFDNPATAFDEGAIDVFSLVKTRQDAGFTPLPGTQDLVSLDKASELPDGWGGTALRGIPFNPSRLSVLNAAGVGSFTRPLPEPLVLVSQRERAWPMESEFGAGNPADRPQYHWEVMFRRFQGRVLAAVFVYRVGFPGGQPRPYSVAPADPALNTSDCPSAANRSPLPVLLQTPFATTTRWVAGVVNNDPSAIPGTNPASTLDLTRPRQMWQVPGQWILDQNNFVHRVLNGRRNVSEGPVRLARPIPAAPPSVVYGGAFPPGPGGVSTAPPDLGPNLLDSEGVATAWYLPIRDARGAVLTPVYILVEEL
jgi:prepilin-type N-terminal cleavage/methylation domain-containing protein